MKIDKLDLEIIKNMQLDARLSLRKLAKTLNIPHTTVFTRVERLVKNGVINKFSAVLYPQDLGFQIGYVIINAQPAESKKVAEKLASYNEVQQVFRTFDGKVISKVVVSNPLGKPHVGFEEFLMKLNEANLMAFLVHEVVKFDESIDPEILKTLEIYRDR
jgi:Lrp/AsnC family leucine-responsive transcriptional regulator